MTPADSPLVGMAMIVKNEARTIEACLESFWDHVDEVVIVDTGSTDDTVAKIKEFAHEHRAEGENPDETIPVRDAQYRIGKLRLLRFEWVNDFSKARQFAWDQLTAQWGVWCDGDDVLIGAENLRPLAASAPDVVGAYIFEYDYARDERGNNICRLQRERLIRRDVGEKWQLPVHEVCVLPPDRAPQVSDAVAYVHNRLPDKFALDRNYKILKREYDANAKAGRPQNARTVGYLGSECIVLGKMAEAIPFLEEHLTLTDWSEEIAQSSYKLVQALLHADEQNPDLEYAEKVAYKCLHARPDWADGYLALMDVAMRKREWDQAIHYARRVQELGPPSTMLITNPLSYKLMPLIAMAQACNEIGDFGAAYVATVEALEVVPGEPEMVKHYARLRDQVKTNEVAKAFLDLRETLVRHDENGKAWKLFEAAPYFIERHPAVLAAKADQRYMVAHSLEDDVYQDYYGDNPNETLWDAHGIDVAEADKYFGRLRFLKAGLAEQKPSGDTLRVLDCGCNDGWMAQHLRDECGYEVAGVELNERAVERARERGITVQQGFVEDAAVLYPDEKFDAVYMFEVIEHVKDPATTLACLEKMLVPGGRIYISTPNGAFENGDLDHWWVVERKGHLRAMTVFEVADLCRSRGEMEGFCVDDRERLLYACYTPEFMPGVTQDLVDPRDPAEVIQTPVNVVDVAPKRRVNFLLGDGWQDFSPLDIDGKGLGGSETAAVKMAEQFADRGYLVTVYAGKGSTRGLFGNVAYRPASEWDPSEGCELFVSSRIPEAFDRPINARTRFLWLHDTDCGERLTERRASQASHVLVLSEWHKNHVQAMYPFLTEKLVVTQNGIDNDRFDPSGEKQPIVVYTSSPDRGLDVLLDEWPKIKERVPKAELHHAYAPVYFEIASKDPHLGPFAKAVQQKSAELPDVFDHGSLTQAQLADLFNNASVWAYPSWNTPHSAPFYEVSCITALEAQAAGLVCVAPRRGALPETLRSAKFLRDTPPTEKWRQAFVDSVVAALEGKLKPATPVQGQGWSDVADQWNEIVVAASLPPALALAA